MSPLIDRFHLDMSSMCSCGSHAASSYGHPQVVSFLVEHGADVHAQDEDGDTPLHACESVECARLLLAAGADLGATNRKDRVVRAS